MLIDFGEFNFCMHSTSGEVERVVFADTVLDKRLFALNMMFIHILALPATLLLLPLLFGLSLIMDYFFTDITAPVIFSYVIGHFIFVYFVYIQWFVWFPKIYQWYKNKKSC